MGWNSPAYLAYELTYNGCLERIWLMLSGERDLPLLVKIFNILPFYLISENS